MALSTLPAASLVLCASRTRAGRQRERAAGGLRRIRKWAASARSAERLCPQPARNFRGDPRPHDSDFTLPAAAGCSPARVRLAILDEDLRLRRGVQRGRDFASRSSMKIFACVEACSRERDFASRSSMKIFACLELCSVGATPRQVHT
eukprot:tig00000430_g590.t1